MLAWEDWLKEIVEWNGGAKLTTRAKAIRYFVKKGLMPFVQSKGYTFGCTSDQLQSRIATGLYINCGKSCVESDWGFAHENIGCAQEERWHFNHVIPSDDWSIFWADWDLWPDVDSRGERGWDRQIDIQEYCWTQLDLSKSVENTILRDMLMNGDDDFYYPVVVNRSRGPAATGSEDVYIRESIESNQFDGWRR